MFLLQYYLQLELSFPSKHILFPSKHMLSFMLHSGFSLKHADLAMTFWVPQQWCIGILGIQKAIRWMKCCIISTSSVTTTPCLVKILILSEISFLQNLIQISFSEVGIFSRFGESDIQRFFKQLCQYLEARFNPETRKRSSFKCYLSHFHPSHCQNCFPSLVLGIHLQR